MPSVLSPPSSWARFAAAERAAEREREREKAEAAQYGGPQKPPPKRKYSSADPMTGPSFKRLEEARRKRSEASLGEKMEELQTKRLAHAQRARRMRQQLAVASPKPPALPSPPGPLHQSPVRPAAVSARDLNATFSGQQVFVRREVADWSEAVQTGQVFCGDPEEVTDVERWLSSVSSSSSSCSCSGSGSGRSSARPSARSSSGKQKNAGSRLLPPLNLQQPENKADTGGNNLPKTLAFSKTWLQLEKEEREVAESLREMGGPL